MNPNACFIMNAGIRLNSGSRTLCAVFRIAPSNIRIIAGSTVMQAITPQTTPFAMTMPRSRPSVKLMKHIARNPATVVRELLTTELTVIEIACAMAAFLSSGYCCCISL